MRVADYIMDRLAGLGIRQVYFLPGGGAMHLNDALGRHRDLEPILCLHEQAAGIAAEAAGKLTGGPAAAMSTCGPGGTNMVTAVLGAWLDSTPVFFLSGQVKTADLKAGTDLRMLGVQEADIVSVVEPITKAAITLTDPESVGEVFDQLEQAALSGRRGPVWLDVPLDVQAAQIDPATLRRAPAGDAATSQAPDLAVSVARTLELLRAAERPAVIAGHGIRMAGGADVFSRLVDRLGIPVLPTWMGMDLIADDHPLHAGRPGSIAPRAANFTLQNCDLLLVLGSRLDMAMTAYDHPHFAPHAKKVVVDIDPAEIAKLDMDVDVAAVGDVRDFMVALDEQAEGLPDFGPWVEQIGEWRKRYPLLDESRLDDTDGVSMYYFTDRLSDLLDEGDVIAPCSSGFVVELFLLSLRLKAGQRCFHNRGTGSMGFGLPAAIGASIAAGRRRTICVEGDGGLQFNIQELATVAAQRLPIKLFVANNGGYASIRTSQRTNFDLLVGADPTSGMALPSLEQLAAAYGIAYRRVTSHDSMDARLREVLASDGPVLCELVVQPDEPRTPRLMTRLDEEGRPVSGTLEDLFPFLPREELAECWPLPRTALSSQEMA